MEHYCKRTKKRVQYYFDPACKKRDFLYEYQVTGWMPLFIRIAQGRVGKRFVVKHCHGRRLKSGKYRKPRVIMTKVPDMSRIVATAGQHQCRNLFKEAVVFAKAVLADEALKYTWKKRYRIPFGRVYYKAMKIYMLYLQRGTQIEPELLPVNWGIKTEEIVPNTESITPPEETALPSQFAQFEPAPVVQMPPTRALRLTG
jgi:hypothetical protein